MVGLQSCNTQYAPGNWSWEELPAVPDDIGFAGAFAGTVDGGLVVAGGANFPDGKLPAAGGVKQWTDRVFRWEEQKQRWTVLGRLPMALGYGASASFDGKLYIAGGSHGGGHTDKVYCLRFSNTGVTSEELPQLPQTLANTGSVLVGAVWYVLGGIGTADAQYASNGCYALDLLQPNKGWQVCPPVPGKGRMLAVVGTDGEALYVFSGVALVAGQREYLRDAYRYSSVDGWQPLPDLKSAVAAAPSPAYYGQGRFYIFGGDDGALVNMSSGRDHPGFSKLIRVFDPTVSRWSVAGEMTLSTQGATPHSSGKLEAPVTTTGVLSATGVTLVMGEVRPGIRTTRVLKGSMAKD
ncbi:kelch repeat type 1-containing protein [Sphingobacterium deserti]|uniref:Kelch repeat type 1-containing protein n=2 Tax=Sphingobacterium deserti TaxID=1229276 RepID=A0A0B8T0C0_9SPHI|nr:kelch repeat type 1-containing protein [Sphingobacterium deserti]